MIRVVVADDHALFRRGIELVLGQEPDIDIVGEASDGVEVVKVCKALQPDVVLLDVRMPKATGLEAAEKIRELSPDTKIIFLTISDDEADLVEAVRCGALGYLLKEMAVEEVGAAVRVVARGCAVITPSMAAKLLKEFNRIWDRSLAHSGDDRPKLSERELEVLRIVAIGKSNKEIADELFISENTVKNHVRNILEKRQLRSRMEAVVYAVREKLVVLA